MKSIKTKLVVLITILISVIILGMGILVYMQSSKALKNTVTEMLKSVAEESSKVVTSRVEYQILNINLLAEQDGVTNPQLSVSEKLAGLSNTVEKYGYMKIGIADLDGNIVYTNGSSANISDREYYQRAIKGTTNISDPLMSRSENKIVVMNIAPIYIDGKIAGALAGMIDGDYISKLVTDILIGDSGYAFMLNGEGVKIAHTNQELVDNLDNDLENVKTDDSLKEIAALEQNMVDGKSGVGEYTYVGERKYLAYCSVEGTDWSIGVNVPRSEVLSELYLLIGAIGIIAILFIVIAMVITFIIAGNISKGIKTAIIYLTPVAAGDFTTSILPKHLNRKDEIGEMIRAVNTAQDSMKVMVRAVVDNSNVISMDAQSLSAISEQMSSSSAVVAASIQEVARGTVEQADNLTFMSDGLDDFWNRINHIASEIKVIDENAKEIKKQSMESDEKMKNLSASVEGTNQSFHDFETGISVLGGNIAKINEITNLINDVAEQTNLLALNAAIEAARAGETGKGFAVVADEIRHLAERSRESAANISKLINDIYYENENMIKATQSVSEEFTGQTKIINNTMESFENIANAIEAIIPKIATVKESTDVIDKDKRDHITRIEEISAIAEETSAATEEITASTEEMTSSSEDVAASAGNLLERIEDMKKEINKFKI
ncbi:MAG: methyl-accepting chemotaxis sensory transducer with Cache sensor [Anaerocolumna sp.]|jgi:methyl-accepting chemotaxis protein|nr:methyl-accepting chemotaxis sensory transducer with Cache sensor [Anaerocolumna sp.]